MDLATLSTLAEQLAPLVLQKIKGKGKKEVSELTTVNDYENVKSLPAWYWNKQTGEKKAVNVSMADFQQHIQDVANENLVEIKQQAVEANTAAQNSAESAAASAASAKNSEDYALAQKNETVDYLNTVKTNEAARVKAEEARKAAETKRVTQENARISAESSRVEEFNSLKTASQAATGAANTAATNANNKASLANTAATNANNAAAAANTSATNANDKASLADTAAANANEKAALANTAATNANNKATLANNAATAANTAATNSDKQTALCKSATDLAEELNAHPQMHGSNGNWWKWNPDTNEYEDTGIIARGGGMYPMVRSRRNHVIWYDSTDGFKERIVRRRNHTIIKL